MLGNLDNIITALQATSPNGRLRICPDNTRCIVAAARQRHELTRAKAIQALRTLDAQGAAVTFETAVRAAAVSRSWLYAQPDIRAEI